MLTPRELEILVLMADGGTNKCVSTALNISDNTVKFHVLNAMRKLAVTTRTGAVAKALRQGIIQ